MAETVNKTDNKIKPEKPSNVQKTKKGFLRRLPKIIFRIFTYLLIFIIALYIFIQTDYFNGLLLKVLVGKANDVFKEKQSTLYVESLEGNLLSDLKFRNASLYVKGDTLIKFRTLEVSYNLFLLLKKEIKVNNLLLDSSEINLTKVKGKNDSLKWNILYLLESDKEKDTTAGEFDWTVKVKKLAITNGYFRILEDKKENKAVSEIIFPNQTQFDPFKLEIKQFNFVVSAEYSKEQIQTTINKMSLNTNSEFNLKNLSLTAMLDRVKNKSEITNLNFQTNRSDIAAEKISMGNFNPLKGVVYENFKDCDVILKMIVKKFNMDDLTFFIPQIDFLNGTASMDLDIGGKYGDLKIKKIDLRTPNSQYPITGNVKNLHDPLKLYFDVSLNNFEIDPIDSKLILPGLPIPDYSHVGKVYGSATYKGEATNFKSIFDIKSTCGNAKGFAELNLNVTPYIYNTEVTTTNLNIGKILKFKELESDINISAKVNGSGFDYKTMNTRVNYELNNSVFYNQKITKSSGIVDINNSNVRTELVYISEQLQANLKGEANISDLNNPKYNFTGTIKGLDISHFSKNASDRSNLNFAFDVNGKGYALENIEGKYDFDFANSYYGEYIIPATPVKINLNNSKDNGLISINSNIIDFNTSGKFNLGDITSVLVNGITSLSNEATKYFVNGDSLYFTERTGMSNIKGRDFDFKYELKTKNSELLKQLLKKEGIEFEGFVRGTAINSNEYFKLNTDFDIKNLSYGDSLLKFTNFNGYIYVTNNNIKNSETTFIAPITADISINSDRIKSGNNFLDSIKFVLFQKDSENSYFLKASHDTLYNFTVKGTSKLFDTIYVNIDSLFAYYNKLTFYNDSNLIFKFDRNANTKNISLDHFNLKSNGMKLNGTGLYSISGNSDITFEATGIKVAEVINSLYQKDTSLYARVKNETFTSPLKGNIRRLTVNYKGNLFEPQLNMEMNSDLLRYENTRVGRIDAFVDYKDNIVSNDILISNAQGKGRMRITGDLPFMNPLSSSYDSIQVSFTQLPIDFKLSASNFQINFFSKLIPNLVDLRGIMNGEISAKGTAENPQTSGNLDITKGRFFVPLTGMYHRFDASIKTDHANIVIDRVKIMNESDDIKHLDVTGKINISNMKINDIDLSTSGDIYVLKKSVEKNDLDIYGDLLLGVGNPPVTLKGNLEQLKFEGQFLIKSAELEPKGSISTPYNIYDDNFIYKIVADSTYKFKDTIYYIAEEDLENIDPFNRFQYTVVKKPKSTKSNFIYDLNIKTVNNANVVIIFSQVPKQELFGQIQGNLNINNKINNTMQVLGDVYVVGNSYVRFYRNFKVKDSKISFNGPLNDINLNIHADYHERNLENDDVQVLFDLTGQVNNPELKLRLFINGNELTSDENNNSYDVQSEAISYLLFGVPRSKLTEGQRNAFTVIGTTTGSSYLSAMLSEAVRTIAPFITSAEINYTQGNIKEGTNVNITSEFGDAIVKIGGRVLSGLSNTEFTVEYPLNKLFRINVSNRIVIELYRTAEDNSSINTDNNSFSTGLKLSYKIRF